MRRHITIFAWMMFVLHGLYIAGALLVLRMRSLFAFTSAPSGHDELIPDPTSLLPAVFTRLAIILFVVGLPCTIVGIGLLRNARWARVGAIVISGLSIVLVPGIGTLLGIYGLWVMFNPETKATFERRDINLQSGLRPNPLL